MASDGNTSGNNGNGAPPPLQSDDKDVKLDEMFGSDQTSPPQQSSHNQIGHVQPTHHIDQPPSPGSLIGPEKTTQYTKLPPSPPPQSTELQKSQNPSQAPGVLADFIGQQNPQPITMFGPDQDQITPPAHLEKLQNTISINEPPKAIFGIQIHKIYPKLSQDPGNVQAVDHPHVGHMFGLSNSQSNPTVQCDQPTKHTGSSSQLTPDGETTQSVDLQPSPTSVTTKKLTPTDTIDVVPNGPLQPSKASDTIQTERHPPGAMVGPFSGPENIPDLHHDKKFKTEAIPLKAVRSAPLDQHQG